MHGRRLLVAAALLTLAAPASAPAAPSPDDATLRLSQSCRPGTCVAHVTLRPSEPVEVAVDFDHAGLPERGFRADRKRRCAPAGTADAIYAGEPSLVIDCIVSSSRLRRAGTFTAAIRLTGNDGVPVFTSRRYTVPGATRTPRRSGLPHPLCAQARGDVKCQDGGGRKVPGGGEKVSHKGWPAITGVFFQVGSGSHAFVGGAKNDELLGRHGNDRLFGKGGKDVLWGDWDPYNNTTRQRDVLDGGGGNDWIYSSHGKNTVRGGAGKDYVWAYYGRGTIDCGPGFDTLRIKGVNRYRHKNCERIKNFCSFGSKPGNKGGCYKPGERPRR